MAETSEAEDVGPDLVRLQQVWKKRIEGRERVYNEYWLRADKVVQRYEDSRTAQGDVYRTRGQGRMPSKRYNILWSNTETMEPLLFNKIPDPVVKRRWGDDRPVARAAAEMLERATTANIQKDGVCFVDHVNASVFNLLVPGTGVLWARYDPDLRPIGTDLEGNVLQGIGQQCVYLDYVHWRDFMQAKANVDSQVTWKARKLWMTPEEVGRRWGPEVMVMCQPQRKPGTDEGWMEKEEKCCIYEIWDKPSRMVFFFAKEMPRLIEAVPDPLGLEQFFPCPKPLYGVDTTSDVIPIPLFCMYQDQASELDDVTTQIYNLLRACKVSGVYNSNMGSDFQKMLEGNENKIIPVTDWPEFQTTGAMQGNVVFMPLDQVVLTLNALYQAREAVKADINEITGMPDIFRGQSSPLDAEGTNDLKVQWGASRMREYQRDVQRFARDLMVIVAEIIAEHFTPQNLAGMSGMNLPTMQEKQAMSMDAQIRASQGQQPPQEFVERLEEPAIEEVVGLLRSDKLRGFMLDIESDSTVESDDTKEREGRAQFIEVTTGFIERWGPIVQQVPQMLPLAKEMLLFAVAPFRAGRQLEEELERTFNALEQSAKQAAMQPQPDPMDKATQAELQKTQMQEAGDTQREAMQQAGQDRRKAMDIAADREARELNTVVEIVKGTVQ